MKARLWLPLAEFFGSTSRYDHQQKSMYFQPNENFYHLTGLSSVLELWRCIQIYSVTSFII